MQKIAETAVTVVKTRHDDPNADPPQHNSTTRQKQPNLEKLPIICNLKILQELECPKTVQYSTVYYCLHYTLRFRHGGATNKAEEDKNLTNESMATVFVKQSLAFPRSSNNNSFDRSDSQISRNNDD